jgi:hypothetical protein
VILGAPMRMFLDEVDEDLIHQVNRNVPLAWVLRAGGVQAPDTVDAHSIKVSCPFGPLYHRDGGLEPSFRVYYRTNTGFCFAGCGYFTPASLYAQIMGVSLGDASQALGEQWGLTRPDPQEDLERALQAPTEPVDTRALNQALTTYLQRVDSTWGKDWLLPDVSQALSHCLHYLLYVSTQDDATRWLETSKSVMLRVITGLKRS